MSWDALESNAVSGSKTISTQPSTTTLGQKAKIGILSNSMRNSAISGAK
jgi:hypothetical protein